MAKLSAVLSLVGGKSGAAALAEAVGSDVRAAIQGAVKSNDMSRVVDTIDAISGVKGIKVDILRGMLSALRADLAAHVVPMEGGNKRTAEQRAAAEKAADEAGLFARAETFASDFTAAVKADAASRKAAREAEKAAGAAAGAAAGKPAADNGADGFTDQMNPATADGVVSRAEFDAMKARAETAETAAREANNRAENLSTALAAARATIERQAADIAALSVKLAAAEAAAAAAAQAKPAKPKKAAAQAA